MMQTFIQATPEEFFELVRKAIREELKNFGPPLQQDLVQFTKKEAAVKMRVSLSTLERLIKAQRIPTINIGKRIFIREADIQSFLSK